MNVETMPTDVYAAPESIATDCNLSTETDDMNTNTLADAPTEPMMTASEPVADSAAAWKSTQAEITASFEHGISAITQFFDNNRRLFITLGWIALAIIAAKFVFAALGTIDDIPLVTPLLKLVGLVSVARFTWRYLIREHDRQELSEIIDRTKVEVLGDRS